MKTDTCALPSIPAVIAPVIMRHVEDAAFYWSQLHSNDDTAYIELERYMHFNRLLEAHLEGLSVAGSEGLQHGLTALKRWKGPAETFVCAWQALNLDDATAMEQVFAQIRRSPGMQLRGLISAVAWAPKASALRWIARHEVNDDVLGVVAALRAAALIGTDGTYALPSSLTAYLASPHAFVRAAACRAARRDDERCTGTLASALRSRLSDNDLAVRAEAAIALTRCGSGDDTIKVLWQCVTAQSDLCKLAVGGNAITAARRLHRWVRELALMVPIHHPDIHQLLDYLPARFSLTFILHHGDCAYLPDILEYMRKPQTARYAGWVWQSLTGLSLEANGWTMPAPAAAVDEDRNAVGEICPDADLGLPLPDVEAVYAAQCANLHNFPTGIRSLLGQALVPAHALRLIEHGPQALRSIATRALVQAFPTISLPIRGPAANQLRQIAIIRAMVNS